LTEAVTVRPEMRVEEALQIFADNSVTEAPVVERNTNRLMGYLRMFDVLHKQGDQGTYKKPGRGDKLDESAFRYVHVARRVSKFPTVAYVMTYVEDIEILKLKTPMARVATVMARDKVQQLPVVDNDRVLLGLLTADVVLKDFTYLLRHLPPEDESNRYEDIGKVDENEEEEEEDDEDIHDDEDDDDEAIHTNQNPESPANKSLGSPSLSEGGETESEEEN